MVRTRQQLLDLLDDRVRSAGVGGLTTAQDVRVLLTDVIDTLFHSDGDTSSFALDSEVVHLEGNESIKGKKSFTDIAVKNFVLTAILTSAIENGKVEYDGEKFYISTGGERRAISTEKFVTDALSQYALANHTHANANAAEDGFMSKEDYVKLQDFVQNTDFITSVLINGGSGSPITGATELNFTSVDNSATLEISKTGSRITVNIQINFDNYDFVFEDDLERWKEDELDPSYAPINHRHDWSDIDGLSMSGVTEVVHFDGEEVVNIPWDTAMENMFGQHPMVSVMFEVEPMKYQQDFTVPVVFNYVANPDADPGTTDPNELLDSIDVTVSELKGFIKIR